jgi:hypothetical protein
MKIKSADRLFFAIVSASTMYFGVLGPAYWTNVEGGIFLGRDWNAGLDDAATFLVAAYGVITVLLLVSRPKLTRPMVVATNSYSVAGSPAAMRAANSFLCVGLLAATYVVVNATGFREGTAGGARDPLLLILYQASDLFIPAILFRLAVLGPSRVNASLIALFTAYAIFIGLRYKLLLLLLPILVLYIRSKRGVRVRRLVMVMVVGLCIVAAFGILTVARSKFGGIDLAAVQEADYSQFIYGLFAETNILFGFAAILDYIDSGGSHSGLLPLYAALADFAPRALFPDKAVVYSYIAPIYVRLGGIDTSTAYPFIGEFYLSAGTLGVALGLVCYVLIYRMMQRRILSVGHTDRRAQIGMALAAVFWGYYYFSRGFTPQMIKTAMFTVVPFLILMALEKRRQQP